MQYFKYKKYVFLIPCSSSYSPVNYFPNNEHFIFNSPFTYIVYIMNKNKTIYSNITYNKI